MLKQGIFKQIFSEYALGDAELILVNSTSADGRNGT